MVIHVYFDPETELHIRAMAEERGVSASAYVRAHFWDPDRIMDRITRLVRKATRTTNEPDFPGATMDSEQADRYTEGGRRPGRPRSER